MDGLRVVVIDDEPATCSYLQAVLGAEGHTCTSFIRSEDAERHLSLHEADLAMVDVYLGPVNGIDLLQRIRALQPNLYRVAMTAQVSVETAARSVAEGAVDYLSKPLTIQQIRALCARVAALKAHSHRKPSTAIECYSEHSSMIGRSPQILEVYKAIGRVAPSNANVLITGASGTGKELVARAIHAHSKRADRPFTAVNCGSFTETILESELFGHERGAFTGASAAHRGLVEASEGGTLFLDEVTETSLSFQVKLLRVIQERQVRRVGSTHVIPVDVRIIAASNRDIFLLTKQGQFREDLYYRLSVVQITVPALDERKEDIPLLVAHFLQQFNSRNDREVSIDSAAIERLQAKSWRGNVRELENAVYRLAIFAPTGQITASDVQEEIARDMHQSGADAGVSITPDRLLDMERQHILRMLKESNGNKSEAARRLGIERKTLYKKARRLGIDLQSDNNK